MLRYIIVIRFDGASDIARFIEADNIIDACNKVIEQANKTGWLVQYKDIKNVIMLD